ncbi:TetR/AcrR family transcriptional regulator [Paraconexibacter sp.]|uniref:TetR/AcrR family transcriptional regulator n=1 Tax=Paraconexibacter sp. TaxID=2949640 RepID=UPI003564001D
MPDQPLITPLPTAPDAGTELPVLGGPARERCDAARNRRRILSAAEALVARDGAVAVSMDQIAAAAGVGKGTLFRRFGDRAGLLRALLSDREGAFQEALIRGPAPLGPGAPPEERLLAFGPAYLHELQDYAELLSEVEASTVPGELMTGGPYALYRTHLTLLLRAANPRLDAEYHADALLTPLSAQLVLHQRDARGMDLERLAAGWQAQARGLLAI